jgi:hypothetical protein
MPGILSIDSWSKTKRGYPTVKCNDVSSTDGWDSSAEQGLLRSKKGKKVISFSRWLTVLGIQIFFKAVRQSFLMCPDLLQPWHLIWFQQLRCKWPRCRQHGQRRHGPGGCWAGNWILSKAEVRSWAYGYWSLSKAETRGWAASVDAGVRAALGASCPVWKFGSAPSGLTEECRRLKTELIGTALT